jgi:hypothetical protein
LIKVERARWRILGFVLSLGCVFGGVYFLPPDLGVIGSSADRTWTRISRLARVAQTHEAVGFKVEQFRERHRRHPTALELKQSFLKPSPGVPSLVELSPYQYIGMPDDFVVITDVSAVVGDDE